MTGTVGTEADAKRLMRALRGKLAARYGGHVYWEEILSEGYLGMWQAIRRGEALGLADPLALALKGGVWAAVEWVRSKHNDSRTASRAGRPLFAPLAYDEVTLEGVADPSAGFETALIDRVVARQRVAALLARVPLSEEEAVLLTRVGGEGESLAAVARELGIGRRAAGRTWQGLKGRLREAERQGDDDGLDGGDRAGSE